MTEPRPAKLAYLTDPDPRRPVLNVQVGDEEIQRFEINRDQLLNLNQQAADILVKAFK